MVKHWIAAMVFSSLVVAGAVVIPGSEGRISALDRSSLSSVCGGYCNCDLTFGYCSDIVGCGAKTEDACGGQICKTCARPIYYSIYTRGDNTEVDPGSLWNDENGCGNKYLAACIWEGGCKCPSTSMIDTEHGCLVVNGIYNTDCTPESQ